MKSFLQVSILCLVSAGNVAWGTVVFSVKFPRAGPWGLVPHRAHQKLLERPVACGGHSQRFRFQWSGQGPWEFVLLMPLKLLQCAARVENQRSGKVQWALDFEHESTDFLHVHIQGPQLELRCASLAADDPQPSTAPSSLSPCVCKPDARAPYLGQWVPGFWNGQS